MHLIRHCRAYIVAKKAAKKCTFPTTIGSAKIQPMELFQVVKVLLNLGPVGIGSELSPAVSCDQFPSYFVDKINHICFDLESGSGALT